MRKIIIVLLAALCVCASSCSAKSAELTALSERELKSGEQLISGEIASVVGNDFILNVGTFSEQPSKPSDSGKMPSGGGEMPSGDGEMPSDSGEMPSGGGEMPSGGGEMPSGNDEMNTSTQINLTGETLSFSIPTGTTVLISTSTLGSQSQGTDADAEAFQKTSFSRIQEGDAVSLLIRENTDGSITVLAAQILE